MNRTHADGRIQVRPRPTRVRPQRARRLRRRELPRAMHLTQRDVEVLEALARHRFLSGEQLRRLVFDCGGSRVRRRLRILYDHGFVERVSVVAQPTRGIPPFLYTLTSAGTEALNEIGTPAAGGGVNTLSLATVRHRLIVNDVFVTLTEAVRGRRFGIQDWRHEQELKLAREDGRGRVERIEHPSLGGPASFLPDAYFELSLGDGSSFAFFVEVDLATHSQRVWRERARLYTAYADPRTGLFRRRFGRETFRLLIVTTPDYRGRSRCDNILTAIRQTVGATQLFLATTLDNLRADRMLGHVWKAAGSRQPVGLVDSGPVGGVVVRPARVPVPARRGGG